MLQECVKPGRVAGWPADMVDTHCPSLGEGLIDLGFAIDSGTAGLVVTQEPIAIRYTTQAGVCGPLG